MFRVSNNLIGILNFVVFLFSVPIFGGGIWLANRASTDCEKFLEKPIIALGVFLMLVSLAGLIGEVLSGKGYKDYKLGDYSNWLQKRVNNNKNWNKIKSCLMDSHVCNSLSDATDTVEQFYARHLSSIQSGCCKPPTECNFQYERPTVWNKTNTTSTLTDCTAWDNPAGELCFNCDSCKAGVLDNLKKDWKKVAVLNIIFLIFLIIVYSIGCCAFRNNREDNYYSGWRKRYP
uniref:Tetraspanin-8-like n=1 Tax=Nelumbo nucifera TaxID=4432 RepID=A0A822Y8F1_NELNU|nr:TPA_asm: hypothetical protein HUJ06_029047 [Nelumbo nucifera]